MKKVFFVILLAAIAPFLSHAQFKNILNKAKSKINQRVDNKIDKGMDNTLDKAEGKVAEQPTNKPEETAATAPATTAAAQPAGFKSYSRFDFIPGEQVVYYENFEQDAIGELPMEWNTNGTAEVVTLGNVPGKWMRLHKQFAYLTANKKEFGDNYTVELDLILQLKNNGWMFPVFNVDLLATKDEATTANGFLKEYKDNASVEVSVYPAENKTSRTRL